MPLYEYTCPVHGKFESVQKLGTEQVPCPHKKCSVQFCEKIEWSIPGWRNSRYGEGEK